VFQKLFKFYDTNLEGMARSANDGALPGVLEHLGKMSDGTAKGR